jgi:hypothetical protein
MLTPYPLRLLAFAPIILTTPLPHASFLSAPGNFPAKADGDYAGGIFSIPLSELPKYAGAGGTGLRVTQVPRFQDIRLRPLPSTDADRHHTNRLYYLRSQGTSSRQFEHAVHSLGERWLPPQGGRIPKPLSRNRKLGVCHCRCWHAYWFWLRARPAE